MKLFLEIEQQFSLRFLLMSEKAVNQHIYSMYIYSTSACAINRRKKINLDNPNGDNCTTCTINEEQYEDKSDVVPQWLGDSNESSLLYLTLLS